MRIIQIATLVTPDGAYGGPTRVAVNQTRALRAAGHDVELVATASGFGDILPEVFDGVSVRLFRARSIPKLGFSGTYSPELQRWLRTNVVSTDIVHIHMGRDLVTLPSALLAGNLDTPYILQTHGMITPSAHRLAGIVDRKWTVPALTGANKVLYLTREERSELNRVANLDTSLEQLANGVPEFERPFQPLDNRPLEVLFLARLHERKRPLMFIELAKQLHPIFPSVVFALVGPDGGQGEAVHEAIAGSGIHHVLKWEGPIAPAKAAERISRCDVYVLPSIDEPFPMSVLEALSLGKPSVVTDTCGLSEPIRSAHAGAVVDESLDSLVAAVSRLLDSEGYRRQIAEKAVMLARESFGMNKIVERLENLYRGAVRDD